jgi:hypothetical protein
MLMMLDNVTLGRKSHLELLEKDGISCNSCSELKYVAG